MNTRKYSGITLALEQAAWRFVAALALAVLVLAALLLCPASGRAEDINYIPTYGDMPAPSTLISGPVKVDPLLQSSTAAADYLSSMLIGRLSPGGPILVSSFVDLEDLNKSSELGRLVPQQISSRLTQYGWAVLDARLRTSLRIQPDTGELMLSRDSLLLKSHYPAEAALVGTYSYTAGSLYVTARIVRLYDSAVIAAYEYKLPLGGASGRSLFSEGDAWQQYAPRAQVFPGGGAGAPVWVDPALSPVLKAIPAAKRRN